MVYGGVMRDEIRLLAIVGAATDKTVGLDTTFESLDMDSLEFVEMILQCDTEWKIKIPDAALPQINTVADLLRVIQVNCAAV